MAESFIYTRPLYHDRQARRHFETDTYKIIKRHLEDPQHVITEEDIRQVRIGVLPPLEQLLPQLETKETKRR